MRRTSTRWAALAVVGRAGGPGAGCVAAAAAGAAGAVYATTRGVESLVIRVGRRRSRRGRETVMKEMGIAPEDAAKTETAGDKHELKGKQGDLDVTIADGAVRTSATTKVEVYAAEESGGVGQGLREGGADADREGGVTGAQ